jgi:MarR family transcriptional regulator, organic hydroperoxide resistance regulator
LNRNAHQRLALGVLKKFRVIFGSVRQHFRAIEESCGLTGSQLWVVQEVQRAPAIGVSELAGKLSIHQSTCSLLVERLVSDGMLSRARQSRDRRRVGLTLTRRGIAALRRAPGPAEGLLPEALIGLSGRGLGALSISLDRLIVQLRSRDERLASRHLSEL